MNYISNIRRKISWIFPLKMLIAAIAGAIGGAGYIGFLSEYATYYYSWGLGFRIPAEGSPYIKVAITSMTFMVIMSSVIILITLSLIMKIIAFYKNKLNVDLFFSSRLLRFIKIKGRTLEKIFYDLSQEKKHEVAFKINILTKITLVISTTIGIMSCIIIFIEERVDLTFSGKITVSLFLFFVYILPGLTLINQKFLMPACLSFILTFLVLSPLIMFNQNIYSSLLKGMGYGGNIKIAVIRGGIYEECQLLLRTSDSLFIKKINGLPTEVPMREVTLITYK